MTPISRRWLLAWLAALLSCLSGCDGKEKSAPPEEKQVVVFAAASLRDVFTELRKDFSRAHPGVEVIFNFAGTQELRTQLEQGASVDVFASADEQHMAALLKAGHVSSPVVFARNEPVIIVSKEGEKTVRKLSDLPQATRLVIGTPEVPIGRYTLRILDRASATLGPDFRTRVEAKVVSRELSVRQVLAKVSLGEADAGIVYKTDALSAKDRLSVVSIPPAANVVATYPIAAVTGSRHPRLARTWVDFILSEEAARALSDAGFLPNGSLVR